MTHPGICIHGGLRRRCETCDLADRLEVAESQLAALQEALERAEQAEASLSAEVEKHDEEAYEDMRRAKDTAEQERDRLLRALRDISAHDGGRWPSPQEMARAALGKAGA